MPSSLVEHRPYKWLKYTRTAKRAAKRWCESEDKKFLKLYNYKLTEAFTNLTPEKVYENLATQRAIYEAATEKPASTMSVKDVIFAIGRSVPVCVVDSNMLDRIRTMDEVGSVDLNMAHHPTPYVYEPKRGYYIPLAHVLGQYITVLRSKCNDSFLKETLDGFIYRAALTDSDEAYNKIIFAPLPKYKLVVGNGVLNMLTLHLEKPDPYQVAFTGIATDWNPNATKELSESLESMGLTIDKLISDFAVQIELRMQLISQVFKSIIAGHSPESAIFLVIGDGNNGKSLLFDAIPKEVMGIANVGELTLDQLNLPNYQEVMENKRAIIGSDNPDNLFIRDNSSLKKIGSRESITICPKYEKSRTFKCDFTVIQLLNRNPSFGVITDGCIRRFVQIVGENDLNGVEKTGIKIETIVTKPVFCQHVLYTLIAEHAWYTDFNMCDSMNLAESLTDDDSVVAFLKELVANRVIDDEVLGLPLDDMYACYVDYTRRVNKGGKLVTIRNFHKRAEQHMKKFGFVLMGSASQSSDGTDHRLSARGVKMQKDYGYNISRFEIMGAGKELNEQRNINKRGAFYARTKEDIVPAHTVKLTYAVGRNPKRCSAYNYFGVHYEIFLSMEKGEYEAYAAEAALLPDDCVDWTAEELTEIRNEDFADNDEFDKSAPVVLSRDLMAANNPTPDPDPTPDPTPTKTEEVVEDTDEVINRAEEIVEENVDKIDELENNASVSHSAPQNKVASTSIQDGAQNAVETLSEAHTQQIDDLEETDPPERADDVFNKLKEDLNSMLGKTINSEVLELKTLGIQVFEYDEQLDKAEYLKDPVGAKLVVSMFKDQLMELTGGSGTHD